MLTASLLPSFLASMLVAGPQLQIDLPHFTDAFQSDVVTLEGEQIILKEKLTLAAEPGAASRIVAASYLRTLTQEIAAAACHLHHGVSVGEASELLAYSAAKFDAITVALRDGDPDLGIMGGEARPKTVAKLEALIDAWTPVKAASIDVLQAPENVEALSVIYEASDDLYEQSYAFLSTIESQYANPSEIRFADIILLEISARMAAMTQRIAYESCRVLSGTADETYVVELLEAKDVFRNSLVALTVGEPSMGIQAAPTNEIAEALKDVGDDWEIIEAYLATGVDGGTLSHEEREDLYIRLAEKLSKVEDIEVMYQLYSERL